MKWVLAATLGMLLSATGVCRAQPSSQAGAPPLSEATLKQLSNSLRNVLIANLPNPLHEASPGWGKTAKVASGIKWRGQGLRSRAEITYTPRNDGAWRKVSMEAMDPAKNLVLDLRDARQLEPGKIAFTTYLAFDARMHLQQQTWESGVMLHDGTVRARFHVKLTLDCEMTVRFDDKGGFLPDLVFRMKVAKSKLEYDHLVVEHIAGVGGDVAKQFGKTAHECLQQWHPSLERNLLAKADAAIVKAGDTKEVRLSLLGKK